MNKPTCASHDVNAKATSCKLKKAAGILALLVLLVVVLSLINPYKADGRNGGASPMTEEAITARIQKIGALSVVEAKRDPKTGEEVFKMQCTSCHSTGVVGAPKFADAAVWGPRIKTGYDALLNSALKGKGNMTAQGGGAFSDYEVARTVVYMANAAGATFTEPAAPADAAAPAAEAAASGAK